MYSSYKAMSQSKWRENSHKLMPTNQYPQHKTTIFLQVTFQGLPWDSYCQAINSLYSSVYFLFFFHRLEVILGLTNKTISCVLSEVCVSITGWMNVSTSACICACTVCTYTRVRCYGISDVFTLSFPRSH